MTLSNMGFMKMLLFSAKNAIWDFLSDTWGFISVGILRTPTLFWIRNLKGRNIRPYPIKLGRSCMHQEKSGHVIHSYVIWLKQKIIWTETQTTQLLFILAVMHLNKT